MYYLQHAFFLTKIALKTFHKKLGNVIFKNLACKDAVE